VGHAVLRLGWDALPERMRSASTAERYTRLSHSKNRSGRPRVTLPCVIPWIIFAVVVVPLLLVGFAATRRRTVTSEPQAPKSELTEQEFEEAEASQAKWQAEQKDRYHEQRLP
jgi:hypothetical protein